jgi:hypothetical protein
MSPEAAAWLHCFPVRHHTMIHAWFAHTISHQGATTPGEVLIKMTVLLGQKLSWSVEPSSRELVAQVLIGLRCDGARAYAEALLDAEAPRKSVI